MFDFSHIGDPDSKLSINQTTKNLTSLVLTRGNSYLLLKPYVGQNLDAVIKLMNPYIIRSEIQSDFTFKEVLHDTNLSKVCKAVKKKIQDE